MVKTPCIKPCRPLIRLLYDPCIFPVFDHIQPGILLIRILDNSYRIPLVAHIPSQVNGKTPAGGRLPEALEVGDGEAGDHLPDLRGLRSSDLPLSLQVRYMYI